MSITPTTPATFYDYNEELVSVPLITLALWAKALRCILDHGINPTSSDVEAVVREKLSTPDACPLDAIVEHIETCYAETKEYYGVPA